mgnify:FL=1
MKDTNAIDKAIRKKCEIEIELIVASFINEIETKLRGEYNNSSFYYLNSPNSKVKFTVMGMEQLKTVLNGMLIEGHIESMLSIKSRELIKKLELI